MPSGASGEPSEPLLQVRDLAIDLVGKKNRALPVVSGASFEIPRAAVTGLFGESGCGKTTLALALMGLLAPRYRARGSVRLNGGEILNCAERQLETLRGAQIALIFQDPMLALNPVLRVRSQLAEAMRTKAGVEDTLRRAGLEPSARILDAYPHQLSGGERQRVLIALALARRPALVIADEPFTALDSARVSELSSLFRGLSASLGTAFLLIDHSPAALARSVDDALVMYAGRIVERGPAGAVMTAPLHPYTAALLKCVGGHGKPLPTIQGNPPGLAGRPPGCAFHPRCERREPCCAREEPAEYMVEGRRAVRCFRYAG